nr:M4 family metallopeptidase [Tumebacillus amylolyticus]
MSAQAASDKHVYKNEKGKVHTVSGKLGKASGSTPEARALSALDKVNADFGFDKAQGKFKAKDTHLDENGTTHTKLDHTVNGLRVFGEQMIVHEANGDVQGVTGTYSALTPTATQAKLDAKQAIDKAVAHTGYTGELDQAATSELLYVPQGDVAVLAYLVNVTYKSDQPGRWQIFVNATDGSIVQALNTIENATGTGTGVLGDSKSINTTLKSGKYYLEDQSKPMFATGGVIRTRDYKGWQFSFLQSDMTDADNVWDTANQRAGVDAHYYAGVVYDYYLNQLGRNSYDNAGHTLLSGVHYGSKYNNAFWDGTQMSYGDGDGTTFINFAGGLDVIAHELTHAVTEKTSNLTYSNQSGALNESWSDAMASVIEGKNWLIGEDIYTPNIAGDSLRSMADPTLNGNPDNMSNYVNTTSDNGGVHTNSGIPNKAFYNFATAIGSRTIAGKVWYTASRDYMTASTDFSGARSATIQAAAALYGTSSDVYNAVVNAWTAVGVN